ncbi:MAG: hypothetical protein JWO31_1829 [Phycisphaerales bacterium]|nr:hypothetical protein [Phycisphaerales bacterium]
MPVNTTTLDGKPVVDPPGPDLVNWFASSTGAGRYGHGLFLLRAEDFATMKSKADPVKLVMRDHTGDAGGLSVNVLVASALPYSPDVGSDNTDTGVVAVRVVDLRHKQDAETTKAFNVQDADFGYDGSAPKFRSGTKNGSAEWTWAQVVQDGLELTPLTAPPAWKPRNVVIDGWPAHRVVDWVAANLFLVAGWDYKTDKLTWHAPGVSAVATDAALADAARIGGGDGYRNVARLPARFSVQFKANAADAAAAYSSGHRRYAKLVDVGGQGQTQPLHVGSYVAAYDGSTPKEQSALDAVAADLAARAYAFLSVTPGVTEYAGIVPVQPDGMVREVFWHSGGSSGPGHLRGARTRVLKGVRFDWAAAANGGLAEFADPGLAGVAAPRHEPVSDQLLVGLGGIQSDVGPAGTRYVWGGGGGIGVKWGKLVTAWSGGNTVTLTPVADAIGTAITPTPANVVSYIINPVTRSPAYLLGQVNDVFAYMEIGPGAYLLVAPQTTPIPARKWEVMQAAAAGKWGTTDYMVAHNGT